MSENSKFQSDFEIIKNLRSENFSGKSNTSTSVFIPDEVIDESLDEWRYSLIGRLDLVNLNLQLLNQI